MAFCIMLIATCDVQLQSKQVAAIAMSSSSIYHEITKLRSINQVINYTRTMAHWKFPWSFYRTDVVTSYGEVGDNVLTSQRRARLVNGEVTR